jgi:ketosteroid isomerase-like protein
MKKNASTLLLVLVLLSVQVIAQSPPKFADPKYTEIGKKGLQALSAGNVDAWMNDFAENARYQWNNGDSLVGRAAITKYWKDRRMNALESINFTNQIWLGVVTTQGQANEAAGTWLLSWYQVDAKYKTGKSMRQWIHTAMHFDANDKIDQVVQYLDRVPINAAMSK